MEQMETKPRCHERRVPNPMEPERAASVSAEQLFLRPERFLVPCRAPLGPRFAWITFLSSGQPEWISVPYISKGVDESTHRKESQQISVLVISRCCFLFHPKSLSQFLIFSTSNLYTFYFLFRLTRIIY